MWLGANPPIFIDRSIENSSSKPIDQQITLRQLCHPLLIWQHQHEDGDRVVPIDLLIQPQIRVVTITGPNTGGKTVTLKTLGLAALMAKAGLFVPAREPIELPWFDKILADIGDEQSLEQSLSTFSGHIRRISRILATMTEKSLILLDEVGAGTDPAEGSALAIALLRYLADHTLLTIATTHFGELKALKYEDEGFENASVEFDDVSLSPTYRLLWGIPGRSNALTIAERLGLKPEITQMAQTLVGGASEDVNHVIAGLESQRRRQETKANEAAKLLAQVESLHQELAQKTAAWQQREQELKLNQERIIQEEIARAKSEIAQVIRRLQKGNVAAQDAREATEAINQITQQKLPVKKEAPPKPGFCPQIGDRIRIPRLGQTAQVLTNPDINGQLTVRFGLMKMTVAIQDIESLNGEKPEALTKPKSAPVPIAVTVQKAPTIRTSQNTIDLRGSRVADAEIELERAIAAATGDVLWIIHGKGTGQLRQGVHEFLQQHPQISHYELAGTADGGSGVTIATLIS